MSHETETMKKKRKVADLIYNHRKRVGYRKKLWDSKAQGTYDPHHKLINRINTNRVKQ